MEKIVAFWMVGQSWLTVGAIIYSCGCCRTVETELPHVELVEADELSEPARGEGGYGSTGK